MAKSNVTQFAEELKLPVGLLLEQLQAAGGKKKAGEDAITEQDKTRLLDYLREMHGNKEEGGGRGGTRGGSRAGAGGSRGAEEEARHPQEGRGARHRGRSAGAGRGEGRGARREGGSEARRGESRDGERGHAAPPGAQA